MSIFIIAEIGINHNGSIDLCKKLINAAKDAGANAVKFQKREIDKVYTSDFLDSYRESPWGKTQREQKAGLEFSQEEYQEIDLFCKSLEIDWFASAWDVESQEFLKNFDLKYNKVASAMIAYEDLLEIISSEGKHTFISTGMSEYKDIDKAVDIFTRKNCSFELMHTVSTYPLNPKHANLRMIQTLQERYKCKVGYSGHEVGLDISIAAATMNISSLERHITLDRSMYGSDQSASIEPNGFKRLVDSIRIIESSLGDGVKTFSEDEKLVAANLRQHLHLTS